MVSSELVIVSDWLFKLTEPKTGLLVSQPMPELQVSQIELWRKATALASFTSNFFSGPEYAM
jgi:hypothetical protein